MNRPKSKTTRAILVGFATSLLVALAPAAGVWATEMAADFTEPASTLPPVDLAQWAVATSPLEAAAISPSNELARDVEGGAEAAEPPGTNSLAMWLPAIASLSRADVQLVDPFLLAVAAIHSSGAARLVRDTVWGLQDPDASAIDMNLPPIEASLAERDSLAAAEVAFVLGNVKSPDPDIVFLAFVAVQSLWGLVCRPRRS